MTTTSPVNEPGLERGTEVDLFAVDLLQASALFVGGYLVGAYCFSRDVWPIDALRVLKQRFVPGGYVNAPGLNADVMKDAHGRIVAYPNKRLVPDPQPSSRTAVFLLIGQSNAANTAGQRYESTHGDRVLNYFAGKFYVASSPLLGTTDKRGEPWTLLGNKLIEEGVFDRIILVSAAIGGTAVSRWQEGADLNQLLMSTVDDAQTKLRFTHVLWHQGEEDWVLGTTAADYSARLGSMIASLRGKGIDAPFFVSVGSWCGHHRGWSVDNAVANAQREMPDERRQVYAGVDTDALLHSLDRYDDVHLSARGAEKFAQAWLDILKTHAEKSARAA